MSKYEYNSQASLVEIATSLEAERDQLRAEVSRSDKLIADLHEQVKGHVAEVERLKAGPSEFHTMIIEADHMLGVHSTTRAALKALLKKYADAHLQIEDWKAYVRLLGQELEETVSLAHIHGWRSTRAEAGQRMRLKLGLPSDIK